VEDAAQSAPPSVLGARCRPSNTALTFEDGGTLDELEIGDAIAYADGYAVGLVRRTAAGRLAAVALLPPSPAGPVRVVDLGATLGDAPPPRLAWGAWRPDELVAAAYSIGQAGARSDASRDLALYRIARGTAPVQILSIPQQRDDSLAFDLAYAESGGLVAWDDAASPLRGVVRTASFTREPRLGPTFSASPADSDAELPRVLPSGAGFVVLWIARRPEPKGVSAGDAAALEATGEQRAYGWLEMIAVDAHGAPAGQVKRLTPTNGHVAAYDVRMLGNGDKTTLLAVARDEGEPIDGSGGSLLRVRVMGDLVEAAVALAIDGLGRGAPTFVEGQPPWLAWVGPQERLRLLPLDTMGGPAGLPSAEEGMDESRPLLLLGPGRMLVATPTDATAQLRAFVCSQS
jgi:hypothetical protein